MACSTPQYAARVTLKTEHKCAETETELPNLLVRVLTPCSPASSHLARPRLHLQNGRRCPARQERTVRLSRLVDFHALLLSPQCHTTGPGMAPVLLADAGILATSGMHTHKSAPISALPRRVPHPRNCRPSALEVILRRPQEPPELHNLLVRVLTPYSPASSHLARQRLHLHNGR